MLGLIASRGLVAAAGLASNVLWARTFDADTFGRYQLIVAATAIVANFCLLGLNDATLISAARGHDGNLGPILRLRTVAATAGAVVVAGWGLIRYGGADPTMTATCLVAALLFVPLQLQPIWLAFVNGKRAFGMLTWGQIAFALANLIGVGSCAAAGLTDGALLPWVMAANHGLMALVVLMQLPRLRRLVATTSTDPSIIRYGHHVTTAMLLAWVFTSDRIIVGEVLSAADVAVLAVALVLPNQVKVFFNAFEQVYLPAVAAAGSVAEAWAIMKPRFARLWAVYTAIGLLGFVLLPVVVPLLFSDTYVTAAPYARWLWLSLCVSSPFTFLATILNSQRDRTFLYLKNLGNSAVTLTLFLTFIPLWGLAGAVGARVTSHLLLTAWHIGYFSRAVRADRCASTLEAPP